MEVNIELTGAPLEGGAGLAANPEVGAWVEFRGLVRGEEAGRTIAALEYEAYAPMAERQMREIVEDIARQHPCLFVRVRHRVGAVPVGQAAVTVVVGAQHRAEAFAMLNQFMDRLKQDVPIWKCRAVGAAPSNPTGTGEAGSFA